MQDLTYVNENDVVDGQSVKIGLSEAKKQNTRSTSDVELYKQYLIGVQAPVVVMDKDLNIVYINEFGARLLGAKPQELTGKKCYDLFKTSDCKPSLVLLSLG